MLYRLTCFIHNTNVKLQFIVCDFIKGRHELPTQWMISPHKSNYNHRWFFIETKIPKNNVHMDKLVLWRHHEIDVSSVTFESHLREYLRISFHLIMQNLTILTIKRINSIKSMDVYDIDCDNCSYSIVTQSNFSASQSNSLNVKRKQKRRVLTKLSSSVGVTSCSSFHSICFSLIFITNAWVTTLWFTSIGFFHYDEQEFQ